MILPARQKGVVLFMLLLVIALAIGGYIFSQLSLIEIQAENDKAVLQTLKKAKDALLHYALIESDSDADRSGKLGYLPCPDYTAALDEGLQDGNCGGSKEAAIGWLPWRTLNLPYLTDDSGACLLYAVSGDYKQSPEAGMLNEDSNGQFQIVDDTATPVEGALPEDRIVAIVFAPGDALTGQSRTIADNSICGQDYANIQAYLEGDGVTDNGALSGVEDTIEQFIHKTLDSESAATPYNDRFVTITREELWAAILQRNDFENRMINLTEALALCLAEYNNGTYNRLPWPAPLDLDEYRDDGEYADANSTYAGRVPYKVTASNALTGELEDELRKASGCDSLTLSIGPVVSIFTDADDEYLQLWKNWKDHFYYALSSEFEPAALVSPGCSGDCISVGGVEVAGVVFFSGSREAGETRNSPPIDTDEKATISNYIENGNDAVFLLNAGDGSAAYTSGPVSPSVSDDIMFCISPALTVSRC